MPDTLRQMRFGISMVMCNNIEWFASAFYMDFLSFIVTSFFVFECCFLFSTVALYLSSLSFSHYLSLHFISFCWCAIFFYSSLRFVGITSSGVVFFSFWFLRTLISLSCIFHFLSRPSLMRVLICLRFCLR